MMKIRDIVNRDIVNLTNCEHEPIHIPGSIQPHGFLVAADTYRIIRYCSGNTATHIGVSHEQLLGKSLEDIFGRDSQLLNLFNSANETPHTPFTIVLNNVSFNCFAHKVGNSFIAEFEPGENEPMELSALYDLNIASINTLETASSLKDLCQKISEQIRKLTGYDRVMIYRFDEQYNGEVFAESREERLEPFLGLHYPHTDIPAQARQLYIRNLLRVIADVNYTPAPIYTIETDATANLDLSMAILRSVSPIHIEYLQNMGVTATLTISLLHEGKLWGLVACHHYTGAKHLPTYTRVSARLLAQLLTSQIKVREVAEEYELAQRVNQSLDKLLAKTHALNRDSFADIVRQQELLAICNAHGAAIVFNGKVYPSGKTPDTGTIIDLAKTLKPKSKQGVYQTRRLIDDYPNASEICENASGIICHYLEGQNDDCIMWFRGESLEEVQWGGDPEKAIIKNEKGLSPRNSFESWQQIIKCSSNPWAKPELGATATFANTLQKHVHLLFLSEEELKYRRLNEQLKEANAELENINWISTHDLKEPLRKIQVFSSRILSKERKEDLSELVLDSLTRMNESANRMQKLITDITSYSRLRHNSDMHLDVDLNEVIQEVQKDLSNELKDAGVHVTVSAMPDMKGIRVLLSQLFLNLFRNALKFRRTDVAPAITIRYEAGQPYPGGEGGQLFHKISFQDNGIGFDNKHKEAIFKVFTRLHNQDEYTGSGIGLALCRQVMQIHGGHILAEGQPGAGARFDLYFPMS